jgi:hypothetical protein
MIIRHSPIHNKFTKLDNAVLADKSLSDGAVRLYAFLRSLRNGANYTDGYLTKALGISQRTLTTRKKELKDHRLITIERNASRIYFIYIGTATKSAELVKKEWVFEDADDSVVELQEDG